MVYFVTLMTVIQMSYKMVLSFKGWKKNQPPFSANQCESSPCCPGRSAAGTACGAGWK